MRFLVACLAGFVALLVFIVGLFLLFNSVDCFVSYGVVFGYVLGSFGLVCEVGYWCLCVVLLFGYAHLLMMCSVVFVLVWVLGLVT